LKRRTSKNHDFSLCHR